MWLDEPPPTEIKKTSRDVVARQTNRQNDRTALLPKNGETEIPPIALIVMLALILFLYVGAEVGFGAWIATVVLREGLSGEVGAVRMARCGGNQEENTAYTLTITSSMSLDRWICVGGSFVAASYF